MEDFDIFEAIAKMDNGKVFQLLLENISVEGLC